MTAALRKEEPRLDSRHVSAADKTLQHLQVPPPRKKSLLSIWQGVTVSTTSVLVHIKLDGKTFIDNKRLLIDQ